MTNSETKTHSAGSVQACQSCKKAFTIEPDDFSFYEKMKVPAPRLCPECRFKRRAQFRNEMMLYSRKCDLCGKSTVSMFSPKGPYTVYCNDCWWSDKWDARRYEQPYDRNRPFFEQLGELTKKVPKAATYSSNQSGPNINSEYTNFSGGNKDCYLIFNSGPGNENCAYSRGVISGKDVYDVYYGDEIERTYESLNIHKSAGVVWGQNITDTLDSWFMLDCSGCQNCFGCVNLRNKSYYFFNESLSKEEWTKRVNEIKGSYLKLEAARRQFEEFSLQFPRRENNNLKSVNSVGGYIFESKNCNMCFETSHCEDSSYSFSIKYAKDAYDQLGHGRKSELTLEGVGVGVCRRVIGGWWVETSQDIIYSLATITSSDCIGCDAIRNGKFMILNKQYSEEEYRTLKELIISELREKEIYGLFMPPEIALFAYNETIAQDNLPLDKLEAIRQRYRWEDNLQMTVGEETVRPEAIPDHIDDVPDTITKEILACGACQRNYRIIPAELQFYRTMRLPIPRQCFYCRHRDRLRRRGPIVVFDRTCAKCSSPIKTSYADHRPEIVHCVACYQAEVM